MTHAEKQRLQLSCEEGYTHKALAATFAYLVSTYCTPDAQKIIVKSVQAYAVLMNKEV